MENIQDFLLDTSYNFTWRNYHERKQNSYRDLYWKCWHLFSVRKYSGHLTQFFNVIILVLAMQNPGRLSIFGCVLKIEAVEAGFSKQKNERGLGTKI